MEIFNTNLLRVGVKHRNHCVICSSVITPLLELPKLPLTDSYSENPVENPIMGIDQQLLYCSSCGHGQLEALIDPNILYGSNYFFRTSVSATARKGTEFFLSLVEEVSEGKNFNCVLDLGCNDLFLLNLLRDRTKHRIGIDPVWKGREAGIEGEGIQLFGLNFEDVDLSLLPEKPDLIVCRHTLEHIIDPVKVVKTLLDIASDDAIFIFEVPGFDGLIERFRFDQVFHQHAQYFSHTSFMRMLDVVGGKYLMHRYNFHDWGAMAIAFTKGSTAKNDSEKRWSSKEISRRFGIFKHQMELSGNLLKMITDIPIYGYGAAQMLPVIGYHMKTDFHELEAVLDDDDGKSGLGYWNLPVKIICSKSINNLDESAVIITAIDNYRPIMLKLLENRPKLIISPLNIV